MSFPPSASCKFLDLPPVNLRNLHLHLTKNPFASRPPHLCGVTLEVRIPKIWRLPIKVKPGRGNRRGQGGDRGLRPFPLPLVASAEAKSLLAEKSCYVCKTNCVVAPIWRDNVRVADRASWGRSCGSAKLLAGTLRCLRLCWRLPLNWSPAERLGCCPKPQQGRCPCTLQGALPLDPFLRPGLSAFPCYPLSLIRLSFPLHYSKKSFL